MPAVHCPPGRHGTGAVRARGSSSPCRLSQAAVDRFTANSNHPQAHQDRPLRIRKSSRLRYTDPVTIPPRSTRSLSVAPSVLCRRSWEERLLSLAPLSRRLQRWLARYLAPPISARLAPFEVVPPSNKHLLNLGKHRHTNGMRTGNDVISVRSLHLHWAFSADV